MRLVVGCRKYFADFCTPIILYSGCGAVRLAHSVRDGEAAGSNPVIPTNITKEIAKQHWYIFNTLLMNFVAQILVSAFAVMFAQWILPGVHANGFITAIFVALALAFLNALVKPILVILTLPVTVVTLGFFLLVINAINILLADWLVSDFYVNGFWSAFLFSIILSITTAVFNGIIGSDKQAR